MTQTMMSPALARQSLETTGYFITVVDPTRLALIHAAKGIGKLVGAQTIGMKPIKGSVSTDWLPRHTESITLAEPDLLPYIALGCLVAAKEGGATCLYDGRRAAELLMRTNPDLAHVAIDYSSTVYPGQQATHRLVYNDPDYGSVLRYRARVHTNRIASELPSAMDEADVYRAVEEALDGALLEAHDWQPGELLAINNRFIIHGREPYEGDRELLRFRYDDPHFKHFYIGDQL